MKWYLFWEKFWHALDQTSCWLRLLINIDFLNRWLPLPMFCYRQECNTREKRWNKYPEQSKQRIIDDIVSRDHKMFHDMMKQGEQ
jgi:hypothetical protein